MAPTAAVIAAWMNQRRTLGRVETQTNGTLEQLRARLLYIEKELGLSRVTEERKSRASVRRIVPERSSDE